MHELAIPTRVVRELPYAVQMHVSQLPYPAQKDFVREYHRRKKDTLLTYVLQFLFSAPYGYLDEWGKQFLYWLTAGGFGIWWFVNLFRIPRKVRRYNDRLADDILRNVTARYSNAYGRRAPIKTPQQFTKIRRNQPGGVPHSVTPPKARKLKINYDPANLSVENLQVGYLLDYDYKTWRVASEQQFDWENGTSEKGFCLVSDLDRRNIYLRKESGHLEVIETKDISIHAIDSNLEKELMASIRPLNVVTYNGLPYYRENGRTGWSFHLPQEDNGKKIKVWEYMNEQRDRVIRLEQYGENQFHTSIGSVVSFLKFSEILPVQQ